MRGAAGTWVSGLSPWLHAECCPSLHATSAWVPCAPAAAVTTCTCPGLCHIMSSAKTYPVEAVGAIVCGLCVDLLCSGPCSLCLWRQESSELNKSKKQTCSKQSTGQDNPLELKRPFVLQLVTVTQVSPTRIRVEPKSLYNLCTSVSPQDG